MDDRRTVERSPQRFGVVLVIDASAALSYLLPDEEAFPGNDLLLSLVSHQPIAPSILWYEVRNALVVNERRNRLTLEQSERFLSMLGKLAIDLREPSSSLAVLELARKHRLSVYDAAYLNLAIDHSAILASLDEKLLRAAEAENIYVFGSLAAQ